MGCCHSQAGWPQSWLVAAAVPPPLQFHTFNGQPTLIRQLPPRGHKAPPVIVAGVKPDVKPVSQATSHQLTGDPWANAWANYKPTTAASGSGIHHPKTTEIGVGSVQQHLQKQDDKIQKMADEIADLQKNQQTARVEVDGKLTKFAEGTELTQQNFQTQMQQMKGDLESSNRSQWDFKISRRCFKSREIQPLDVDMIR